MSSFLFGVCHPGRAYDGMTDVGINAVRLDVPFPFSDESRTLSTSFERTVEWVRELRTRGFQLVGITPYPSAIPSWRGEPGSDGYFSLVRETARFLAEFFGDNIPVWQSTNEMNVPRFREPLNEVQAVRFLIEGGAGIKDAAGNLDVGVNMGGFDKLATTMYRDVIDSDVKWDYVGTDGYFGTWEEGSPQTWNERLDWLESLSSLPIYVMEWGFSSAGDIMLPEKIVPGETDTHAEGAWCWGWDTGSKIKTHTWDNQADYISEALEILYARTIGAFYYCWGDSRKCWCTTEGCPIECNWGLVDVDGSAKPSYRAMQKFIASHR